MTLWIWLVFSVRLKYAVKRIEPQAQYIIIVPSSSFSLFDHIEFVLLKLSSLTIWRLRNILVGNISPSSCLFISVWVVNSLVSEREVCLLFWLKICSIIGAYFIPIQVLKLQLKIIVKTSAKTRGFLSLFFLVFILYSRAILGFSLSPSLLLCAFHCFNCWIIIEKFSC